MATNDGLEGFGEFLESLERNMTRLRIDSSDEVVRQAILKSLADQSEEFEIRRKHAGGGGAEESKIFVDLIKLIGVAFDSCKTDSENLVIEKLLQQLIETALDVCKSPQIVPDEATALTVSSWIEIEIDRTSLKNVDMLLSMLCEYLRKFSLADFSEPLRAALLSISSVMNVHFQQSHRNKAASLVKSWALKLMDFSKSVSSLAINSLPISLSCLSALREFQANSRNFERILNGQQLLQFMKLSEQVAFEEVPPDCSTLGCVLLMADALKSDQTPEGSLLEDILNFVLQNTGCIFKSAPKSMPDGGLFKYCVEAFVIGICHLEKFTLEETLLSQYFNGTTHERVFAGEVLYQLTANWPDSFGAYAELNVRGKAVSLGDAPHELQDLQTLLWSIPLISLKTEKTLLKLIDSIVPHNASSVFLLTMLTKQIDPGSLSLEELIRSVNFTAKLLENDPSNDCILLNVIAMNADLAAFASSLKNAKLHAAFRRLSLILEKSVTASNSFVKAFALSGAVASLRTANETDTAHFSGSLRMAKKLMGAGINDQLRNTCDKTWQNYFDDAADIESPIKRENVYNQVELQAPAKELDPVHSLCKAVFDLKQLRGSDDFVEEDRAVIETCQFALLELLNMDVDTDRRCDG